MKIFFSKFNILTLLQDSQSNIQVILAISTINNNKLYLSKFKNRTDTIPRFPLPCWLLKTVATHAFFFKLDQYSIVKIGKYLMKNYICMFIPISIRFRFFIYILFFISFFQPFHQLYCWIENSIC